MSIGGDLAPQQHNRKAQHCGDRNGDTVAVAADLSHSVNQRNGLLPAWETDRLGCVDTQAELGGAHCIL